MEQRLLTSVAISNELQDALSTSKWLGQYYYLAIEIYFIHGGNCLRAYKNGRRYDRRPFIVKF